MKRKRKHFSADDYPPDSLGGMIREWAKKNARKFKSDEAMIKAACAQGGFVTYSNGMTTQGLGNAKVVALCGMELIRAGRG